MSAFRYAAVVLAVGSLAGVVYAVASGAGQSSITAQRFVNLQEGDKPYEGFRRAHAKGFCVVGEFQSSGKLALYSTAQVFQPGQTGLVGRISIAGTDPTAPDLRSPVRSLALSLGQGDANGWRTAMNTPPVMAVGTPEAFYEQLSALAPDPATGQRNPERIQAFFASHPETQAFLAWQKGYVCIRHREHRLVLHALLRHHRHRLRRVPQGQAQRCRGLGLASGRVGPGALRRVPLLGRLDAHGRQGLVNVICHLGCGQGGQRHGNAQSQLGELMAL